MKRFIVFAGSHYYPLCGIQDFAGHCDCLDDACLLARTLSAQEDWVNILDTQEGEWYKGDGEYMGRIAD